MDGFWLPLTPPGSDGRTCPLTRPFHPLWLEVCPLHGWFWGGWGQPAPWESKEGSGGAACLNVSSQHFLNHTNSPCWCNSFSTSLTKGACDPCPQDMPATGSPGWKFILEQSEMNQSSWVWHREADWVPPESGTASPMAKHPSTSLRWDWSSPCHRRDGGTPSGHTDTDSQSARSRAGAECCNAIFSMTTLFVWQPKFYRNDLQWLWAAQLRAFKEVTRSSRLGRSPPSADHPMRPIPIDRTSSILKLHRLAEGFFCPGYLLPTTALPGLFQKLTLLVRNCLISTQTYVNIAW